MLRELIRKQIFERFPLFFGAASSLAVAILVGWLIAVRAGPAAIPVATLLYVGFAAAALGAWAIPRLTVVARTNDFASRVEGPVFAMGFIVIALAATVVTATAAFGAVAALLAVAGLPADTGLGLLRAGTIFAVSVVGATLVWGFRVEGRLIEMTFHRVEIAGLAPALRGRRIAHLSDLHIGNGLDGARLAALIERVNGIGADLIVVTGDLFVGADDVASALATHAPGIELLRGRWAVIATPGPLLVAGLDDPGHDWEDDAESLAALEKLAAARPFDAPSILLAHRPEAFPLAAPLGFSLVLSGHYHGGQVAVPLTGGRINTARALTHFDRGLHRSGGAALYVSRGLGFAGPRLRVASRPEIALLELA